MRLVLLSHMVCNLVNYNLETTIVQRLSNLKVYRLSLHCFGDPCYTNTEFYEQFVDASKPDKPQNSF